MATATASGVDELHSGREGERAEEGEEVQGLSEGVERECVALGAGSRSGGSRRWLGRVPACGGHAPLSFCQRRKKTGEPLVG